MSLFVGEEEDNMQVDSDSSFHEAYEQQPGASNGDTVKQEEEDDDPVVHSIPLILNHLPNTATQSLHLLQYPGRPRTLPYTRSIRPSIKEDSAYLELKVPLDTSKFYDQSRSDDWGMSQQITEHGLQGVLNKTNDTGAHDGSSTTGGLYVASISDSKVVLVPVDSTTQLRPSFKYLDDLELAKAAQRRSEFLDSHKQQQASIQVLQTSNSKSAAAQGNTGEGFANHALGESLRCVKKFEEEDWKPLAFSDGDDARALARSLVDDAPSTVLHTKTTMSEYLTQLTDI